MPCIRGLAQGLLSLAPGVWTERHRSIPEIFLRAPAPYPGSRPPGYFHRERDSPARFTAGLLPHTPSLARRGIFIGRGTVPPGSPPGFCPISQYSPAGVCLSGEGQPCPVQHRAFAPYPGARPPGHFPRERVIPAQFTAGLLPRTPALARRGIFIGRGTAPPGSAPGFCPYPVTRPPGYSHRERDSPDRISCR